MTCPACGEGLIWWRNVFSLEPRLNERFSLIRCSACGTAVTDGPIPDNLYESGAYNPAGPRFERLAKPALRIFDFQRLRLLAKLAPPPARLLDVGAGRGRFVAAACAAGYAAEGLEPSPARAEAARARGVSVIGAPLETAPIAPSTFDVVSLWHVLEHVDEPGASLAIVAQWLRPGGFLLLGVPNLTSLQATLGGPHWYHLDVPRHRTHFTVEGLLTLLRRSGFEPIKTHHLLLEHNLFGMWQSLVNRVTRTPSYLFNLLKRNAPLLSVDLVPTLLAVPLVPLTTVLEFVAGAARRGGTVAVIARRPFRYERAHNLPPAESGYSF